MTQPEYTGKDRSCDCAPPNICEILAELKAMKNRIENMIVSVQGLPGDHAGNVQLPFAEDIGDSTMGVSGTFAGGHAVLQVKAIADNADETANNAQDIAQIAADAANSASQSASRAFSKAAEADGKAQQALSDAGTAWAVAAGIGPSVTFDDPSRRLTVEVNGKTAEAVIPGGGGGSAGGVSDVQVSSDASDVYLTVTKDGATDLQEIGAVSASAAGVLTPVQYQEISDNLDSLGESLNKLSVTVEDHDFYIHDNSLVLRQKADQSDLDDLSHRVTANEGALVNKADTSALNDYLPRAGGTMTGDLTVGQVEVDTDGIIRTHGIHTFQVQPGILTDRDRNPSKNYSGSLFNLCDPTGYGYGETYAYIGRDGKRSINTGIYSTNKRRWYYIGVEDNGTDCYGYAPTTPDGATGGEIVTVDYLNGKLTEKADSTTVSELDIRIKALEDIPNANGVSF